MLGTSRMGTRGGAVPEQSAGSRKKRAPDSTGALKLVAGVRFETQQRNLGRDLEALEIVEMAFEARGTALVPLGAPGA